MHDTNPQSIQISNSMDSLPVIKKRKDRKYCHAAMHETANSVPFQWWWHYRFCETSLNTLRDMKDSSLSTSYISNSQNCFLKFFIVFSNGSGVLATCVVLMPSIVKDGNQSWDFPPRPCQLSKGKHTFLIKEGRKIKIYFNIPKNQRKIGRIYFYNFYFWFTESYTFCNTCKVSYFFNQTCMYMWRIKR